MSANHFPAPVESRIQNLVSSFAQLSDAAMVEAVRRVLDLAHDSVGTRVEVDLEGLRDVALDFVDGLNGLERFCSDASVPEWAAKVLVGSGAAVVHACHRCRATHVQRIDMPGGVAVDDLCCVGCQRDLAVSAELSG